MKTYTLSVTGTQTYTFSRKPMRHVWGSEARREGDTIIIIGKRKPRLRYWRELLVYYAWTKWRPYRVRF